MALNNSQRLVVILGVAMLAGMTLLPPWEWLGPLGASAGGYGFIFMPTDAGAPGDRLDIGRLVVQLMVVTLSTVGLVIALGRTKDS